MSNTKFYTTIVVCLAIILLAFYITGNAQTNQIEGKFIYHPDQNKLTNTDGFGGGLELTTNLGEYIKLLQSFSIEKSRQGDVLQNFDQRDISLQSTVRFYPVEGYKSFKPFVQGGIRLKATTYNSSVLIPLPGDPGTVGTENKFTYTSPIIGAGVNFKDYYILDYNYILPDFTSKLNNPVVGDFKFANALYRERGHALRAKLFLPIGGKFSFNPAFVYQRTRYEFTDFTNDYQVQFGLAYVFAPSK